MGMTWEGELHLLGCGISCDYPYKDERRTAEAAIGRGKFRWSIAGMLSTHRDTAFKYVYAESRDSVA